MRIRLFPVAAMVLALAACADEPTPPADSTPSADSTPAADSTPSATTQATEPEQPFTPEPITSGVEPAPDDINFAQMMIGHHLQALELVELARSNSSNLELLALADEIEAAQGPEIEQMTWWVAQEWGYEVLDPADHEDHEMAGMMTRDGLNDLAALTGTEFDTAWLEGMIFHHEGAVDMAEDELAAGVVPEVREMAQEVITVQQSEIVVMQEMIDQLRG
ncbi:MAG: DUF305 domain-containing protein [Beutenbergiaceae bacterium]